MILVVGVYRGIDGHKRTMEKKLEATVSGLGLRDNSLHSFESNEQ